MAAKTIQDLAKDTREMVSVILPIYNAGAFLDQALDSVQNQTYQDLEIICVNDGSTDNSLEIIQAHAATDPRIVVVDKENAGYGAGMNKGLSIARGTWIAILEPDDWFEPGMIRGMLSYAADLDAPVDMIKTPFWRIVNPDTDQQQKLNCNYRIQVKPKQQPCTINDLAPLLSGNHHPSIWSALYRKAFLDDNDIKFLEIPGAGWADNPFFMETLCRAKSIAYLDTPYYCYREESREKAVAFHRNNPDIPFERWHQMLDIMEQTGITNTKLLAAHYTRGFTYMGGVLEQHPLDESAHVKQLCIDMLSRMDATVIESIDELSPSQKKLFYELSGNEPRKSSKARYGMSLAKKAAEYVLTIGPANTLKSTINHVKRAGSRSGQR